ncbi:MAG TPA: toll/interleukin-1 receptor domain-containing protein [Candidatus Kryptonia bacterium]|nr:toll/interleukin-1 receptor domain-containing protein [Candidatus Kryptonia bacterium]
MAYRYSFDRQSLGDWRFDREDYDLIQQGLVELLKEVDAWNAKAAAHDAAPPYTDESRDLHRMIAWGSEQSAQEKPWVSLTGASVGTMRYLRAGLELVVRRKRNELEKNRVAGWPSGVLESLKRSLQKVEQLAADLKQPPADILWEVIPDRESGDIALQMRAEAEAALWDAFISHATEDQEAFVRPLAEALHEAGLRIWYAEFSLKVGDSLRRAIDKGLSSTRYGIVVLSPMFFAKEWPQRELDGLVAREAGGRKVILPVWHNVDFATVCKYSPTLADRVATQSRDGLSRVVQDLLAVLRQNH